MNNARLQQLIQYIKSLDGICNKTSLALAVKEKFNLTIDRKIYYCSDFAIRFSQSKSQSISNTILSLSNLQKYDNIPVISCTLLPSINVMLLCNSTCLKKISHSSQQLRVDNIKGSFNHSDIMKVVCELPNVPENFEKIFAIHCGFSFEENLIRLVETTNGIVPTGHRFCNSSEKEKRLLDAPLRAKQFVTSKYYEMLKLDLNNRVEKVKNEIAIAAFIDNVNIKGNIIEYLITSDGGSTRNALIDALVKGEPLPPIRNSNDLGDYNFSFSEYETKTDIKTKVLFLNSNPKAYNIDKLLEFLSTDKSIYFLYLIGIDANKEITTFLCPLFSTQLLKATRIIQHWAGRNSRGVAQFNGESIAQIIRDKNIDINLEQSQTFIKQIIEL